MDAERVGRICRLTLMQVAPAALTGDIRTFGAAITEIQEAVGEYFAPYQGGRFATETGCEVTELALARGAHGVGQSSWGPTVFALVRGEPAARALADALRGAFGEPAGVGRRQPRAEPGRIVPGGAVSLDLGLNRRAARLADALAADAALLGVAVTELGRRPGARLRRPAPGGLEAGRRLAEICLAGLATVSFTSVDLGGLWLPAVAVTTDHPVAACLASQYAGWAIDPPGYFAMGSGPARSVARVERELYERIGYAEAADTAVLVLEGRALPDEGVVELVADKCRVAPEGLRLLIAPTASIAGCVQVAARSVETGLHKMLELGFDVRSVRSGAGVCPLAPVAKNDLRAIGWTNDCILYGTRAYFAVHADDAEVAAMVERLPASTSPDYGTPFYEIFKRAGNEFYKIDRMLFSPAEVVVNNLASGRVFRAGRLDPERAQEIVRRWPRGSAGSPGGAA